MSNRSSAVSNARRISAQIESRGKPIIHGSLETCLEHWQLLSDRARSGISIRLAEPIELDGKFTELLLPDDIHFCLQALKRL